MPSERARLVFGDPHFEHVQTSFLIQWRHLARLGGDDVLASQLDDVPDQSIRSSS